VFKYSPAAHNVVEVSKADHDSCTASRPLATFATGDDTVPLPAGGVTRYFICGVPGHCDGGMKLAVRVEAAASAPAPVAMAPRAARPPTKTASSSPAPMAMVPRAALPPMATPPGAKAPAAAGGMPEEPTHEHRCIRWLSEEPTPWKFGAEGNRNQVSL